MSEKMYVAFGKTDKLQMKGWYQGKDIDIDGAAICGEPDDLRAKLKMALFTLECNLRDRKGHPCTPSSSGGPT